MKEKPYILVVDDDPNIAKLEQLYLEKAGYEVKTVGRGDDAMTEFRKMPPDLMLLDVMMPQSDFQSFPLAYCIIRKAFVLTYLDSFAIYKPSRSLLRQRESNVSSSI